MTLKTFLVEDSPVIRDNLGATLEEMLPLEVVGFAEDEAGALRWLRDPQHGCDLVIVDIFLKGGSGLGVLRQLQAAQAAPVRVVLSNYATEDMRRQCLALGATRVFDKSCELDGLLDYCAVLAAGPPASTSPLLN